MGGRSATRRGLLAAAGAALTTGLAGCLRDDAEHAVGNPEPFVEVGMRADGFEPAVVHLVEGGAVEWVVEDASHDVVAAHPDTHRNQRRIPADAEPWESGLLREGGDAFDHTFEIDGVYDYVCTVHESTGMVGSVVVGWPEEFDEEPGLDTPADEYPPEARDAIERHTETVRTDLEEEYGRPGITAR